MKVALWAGYVLTSEDYIFVNRTKLVFNGDRKWDLGSRMFLPYSSYTWKLPNLVCLGVETPFLDFNCIDLRTYKL